MNVMLGVLVLSVALAGPAAGQSAAVADLLAPPGDGLVLCRQLAAAASDSAATRFQFRFEGGREIQAVYDSTGVPRLLEITLANAQDADRGVSGLTARFGPGGAQGARGTMGAGASAVLSFGELLRARELMTALWNRRCR